MCFAVCTATKDYTLRVIETVFITLRGLLHHVACYITWLVTSRGLLHHVACYITWIVTSRGLLHHVDCYITWIVTSRGLLHHVDCYTTWLVTSRGLLRHGVVKRSLFNIKLHFFYANQNSCEDSSALNLLNVSDKQK
jgi:hypothetical protein